MKIRNWGGRWLTSAKSLHELMIDRNTLLEESEQRMNTYVAVLIPTWSLSSRNMRAQSTSAVEILFSYCQYMFSRITGHSLLVNVQGTVDELSTLILCFPRVHLKIPRTGTSLLSNLENNLQHNFSSKSMQLECSWDSWKPTYRQ